MKSNAAWAAPAWSASCAGAGGKRLGLRADMDALPIQEATGLEHASCNEGIMHACGHDGHTAMLLAAAHHLARHGEFDGTLNLIFQPAEEGLGGAKRMMEDGLFSKYPCDAIFAMHNMPGHPQGHLLLRDGAAMASSDNVTITLEGVGGHGAMPHCAADPVVAGAAIVMGLQSIVARNVDPLHMSVITVGAFNAGKANNVIPQTATLSVRALDRDVRNLLEDRITELVHNQAASYQVRATIDYKRGYPVLVNTVAETDFARQVALELVGADRRAADAAADRQRGLRLHAGGSARLVPAGRQRRWLAGRLQQRPRRLHGAQPRLRLQRPQPAGGRGVLVLLTQRLEG